MGSERGVWGRGEQGLNAQDARTRKPAEMYRIISKSLGPPPQRHSAGKIKAE
jgi:hypothetical protein